MSTLLLLLLATQDPTPETTTTTTTSTTTSTVSAPKTLHEQGGLLGIGLVVAPHLGVGLGSVFFNGLGVTATPSLEVGYLLPLPDPINRDIELFANLSYAAPTTDQVVSSDDPRIADGTFHFKLTLHQVLVTPGALYRIPIPPPIEWLRPTVALGPQLVWSKSVVNGDAGGERFATVTEDAFDVGVWGAAGADIFFGPGAIATQLTFGWAPANRFILRETSTTSVGVSVGYRFFL